MKIIVDKILNKIKVNGGPGSGRKGHTTPKEYKERERHHKQIIIKGDELGSYSDIKELRNKAIEYYKANFQGNDIEREGLGIVRFSNKGISEFKSSSANPDKLKAIPYIKDIILNGNIGDEEIPHHPRKDGIVSFIPVSSTANIEGKKHNIEVLLGKDRKGNLFYNVFLDFERQKNRSGGSGNKPEVATNSLILAYNSQKVNTLNEEYELNIFIMEEEKQQINNNTEYRNSINLQSNQDTKYYKRIFIVPGIVNYEDDGDGIILLNKETIDKALKGIIGTNVYITHDGTEPVGEVVDAYYDAEKASFICGFMIWNKEAQELLDDKEYSISCTYSVREYSDGGLYHNIKYDKEAIDISFKNIAIVETPRFQEAREYINSITNNIKEEMNLFKRNSIDDKDKSVDTKNNEVKITYKGKQISADELLRVILEEAEFHKGKPVDDKSESEENPQENDIDKRKDIDDIAGFLKSKGLSDEDIRYVIGKDEQLAYDKSEAGNDKDNAGDEDHTDKRKLIDEIGGILKGKVDEELWRTIIGKAEKIAYEGSETSNKDNSCRNEMPSKTTQQQEKVQQKTGEDRIRDKVDDDEKKNSILSGERAYRNSIEKGSYNLGDGIISREDRIKKSNAKYSLK